MNELVDDLIIAIVGIIMILAFCFCIVQQTTIALLLFLIGAIIVVLTI